MNNHPALTRLLLVAMPTAIFGALIVGFIGPEFALAALALGVAVLVARSRSMGAALRGPWLGPWWAAPLMGLVLIGAAFALTALPGPGDLRWGMATLLGLVGMVTVVGSLLLPPFVHLRPSQAE